jgi:molybdenum cofactor synthesis domain-containing protein
MIKVAIITVSDKGSKGLRQDKSGELLIKMVEEEGWIKTLYLIIPDEKEEIEQKLKEIADNNIADLILTTGGTGFAPRDVTPEATKSIIEKEVPGIPEKIRYATGVNAPMAYLSRGVCGIRKFTLIINFPGSTKAVKECFEAVKDLIPHGINILKGEITEH